MPLWLEFEGQALVDHDPNGDIESRALWFSGRGQDGGFGVMRVGQTADRFPESNIPNDQLFEYLGPRENTWRLLREQPSVPRNPRLSRPLRYNVAG